MATYYFILFSMVIFCYALPKPPSTCLAGQKGYYCAEDLSSYHFCKSKRLSNSVTCPTGTRCTCYFGQECEVPTSSICRDNVSPFPNDQSYYWSASGTLRTDTGALCLVREEVKQDFSKKLFRSDLTQNGTNFFIVIRPNENGTFCWFSGDNVTRSCRKDVTPTFDANRPNLGNIAFSPTTVTNDKQEVIQDWMASFVANFVLTETWRLKFTSKTNQVEPLQRISTFQFPGTTTYSFKRVLQTDFFAFGAPDESSFDLPEFCNDV
ncbi:uncharacterized protein LOC130622449 [Hydractinia symbiolongicarpus]|uniref:uncharacterized protein LOC130622449 n=1 Tax=Hydractinia symbiolongicarpus TaxID=13093 RepID=UPI00254E1162|nr:uncharacterized protein LOC130622449 [Hydractinia symbiolongicarpus]